MKPRVFIAIHYLELGGAETSLIGLLHAFDPKKVDIDLFVYSHQGELMKYIPEYVNLLPEVKAYSVIERPIKEAIMAGQFGVAFGRLIAKYKHKRHINSLPEAERTNDISVFPIISSCIMPYLPDLGHLGKYDLAISYLQPHDIVRNKVRAKKYLAWIHTDYSTVHVDRERECKIWGRYDCINSISPECTKGFLSTFPELADKIIEIENILPKSIILEKANLPIVHPNYKQEGIITLCSAGRITHAKNYDNVPYMAKALKASLPALPHREASPPALSRREGAAGAEECINNNNYNEMDSTISFHWYIIGPGDHAEIDALSEKMGVSDVVTFLGPTDNPYPYINACDIYVHPSRYEGKSITVREAQVLCKPVIITNYPTAHSQINDGVDGIICEQDNEKIAEAIYQLATDKQKQEALIKYLKEHDMSGQSEVEKIYNLID